jgi:hypothetical protein
MGPYITFNYEYFPWFLILLLHMYNHQRSGQQVSYVHVGNMNESYFPFCLPMLKDTRQIKKTYSLFYAGYPKIVFWHK